METVYKLYEASKCQEAKLAAFKILHRYSKSQSYFFSKILIISHSLKLRPQKKRKRRKNKSSLWRTFFRIVLSSFVRRLNKLPTERVRSHSHTHPRPIADKNSTDTHWSPWPASSHSLCVQTAILLSAGWQSCQTRLPPASFSIVSKIRIWSQVSEDQAQWHELGPLINHRGQETKCSMMLLARWILFQPHSSPFASA